MIYELLLTRGPGFRLLAPNASSYLKTVDLWVVNGWGLDPGLFNVAISSYTSMSYLRKLLLG